MSGPDNYASITPSKLLAEVVKRTRGKPAFDLPQLNAEIVKTWFNPKWFTPTDQQALDFANFLRKVASRRIERMRRKEVGLPANEKYEEAVQVLLEELDPVIRRTRDFEIEMGISEGPERRFSSALAKLLLAAREVATANWEHPDLSITLSPIDEKNERAVAIFNLINRMARDSGALPKAPDSRNDSVMSIVVAAMEACGWSVTPTGVAKTIRDHGRDLQARRQKKGKKLEV